MNLGCRIADPLIIGDKKLAELFTGIPVAIIDDCMNRLAAFGNGIIPMNSTPLLGTAFTVKVPEGDNLMLHKALDMAMPGDVIVISSGNTRDRAIFGELISEYCRIRGIKGIVTDGFIRDSDALKAYKDFSVYAAGISPNGPYKNGPGEIGFPISIGGQTVYPGDIIVGDCDGVLAIPADSAGGLLPMLSSTMEKERKIKKNISEGRYIRPWVDEKLNELGIKLK